jgi:hypothetical protein
MASPATVDKAKPRNVDIDAILRGAIDLHCHSGPSVMPRRLDHIEAVKEAAEAGIKAILFKDHYYSVTPVTELLKKHYGHYGIRFVSGLALNNTVGGINRYAVDHTIKLGGDIIWMPTFSSANHIAHHKHDKDFGSKFPSTKEAMLAPTPLKAVDDKGQLLDEVKFILDLIAERNLILSSGHLHISEIWPLFDEAKKRGVKRLLVNHPTFVVDATIADIKQLAALGAYIEHSVCMFIEGSKFKCYEPNQLKELIEAGTLERTILGSDLGQVGNPTPVTGFRSVIQTCLDIGYTPDQIRQMISVNPSRLLGMPAEGK